jgi:hypothetical protein
MQIDCGVAECDAAGNLITPTHHGVWMLAAVAAIVFVLPNFRRGTR